MRWAWMWMLWTVANAGAGTAAAQTVPCDEPRTAAADLQDTVAAAARLSDKPPLTLEDVLGRVSYDFDPRSLSVSVNSALDLVPLLQDHHERNLPEPVPPEFKLPATVELTGATSYFDAKRVLPNPMVGALHVWDGVPAPLTDAQVKSRRAMAEMFTRLARNRSNPTLTVTYNNEPHVRVGSLIRALVASDHEITARVQQDVANFMQLHWKEEDGSFREVFAPVRIKTGYKTPDDRDIVVPAVHSSLVIEISGPDVNTTVEFYQGLRGTDFRAGEMKLKQSWVGGKTIEVYEGAHALLAMETAAEWVDVISTLAEREQLAIGGYGRTGVCNDAVALVQMVVKGRTSAYPLVTDKPLLLPYLKEQGYSTTIYDAVVGLPYDGDDRADASRPQRILDSIPFEENASTPYPGVTDARNTLGP